MATKDLLKEQFEELGIDPTNEILNKCVELCSIYNIDDAEDFVEQWMAFSVSNFSSTEPTLEHLNDMERREYVNKKNKDITKIKKMPEQSEILKIYNIEQELPEENNILDSYICHSPKNTKVQPLIQTPKSVFSPACYSPLSTTTQKNSTSSGKVAYTFGNTDIIKNASWMSSSTNKIQNLTITPFSFNNDGKCLINDKAMVNKLYESCNLLGNKFSEIGNKICANFFNNKNGANVVITDYDELNEVDAPSQYTVNCVGRICCESDNKLNEESTILIGSDDLKLRSVNLNFTKINSYSIFPGEIVFAKGMNPRGDQLFVEQIITDYELQTTPFPKNINEPISLVIAAGPYTPSNDLSYEPLNELLNYCKENQPDVVILIGPFLSDDNNLMGEVATDYDAFFEKILNGIIDVVGKTVQILCVSSAKDIHSTLIYPTLPFTITKQYPNLKFLPDPCLIKINDLTIGITATDILQHLLEHELIKNAGHDKIKRALNYLFHQQTFYPLNPPHDNIFIDSNLCSLYASLKVVPNMMIVPSDLTYFIRDINNCLAINPGKVVNTNGGTFARMIINPVKDETKLNNFIASQVIKI